MYEMKKSFSSFIVSDCNAAAYEVCLSVVQDADVKFLALHGPSACGKSHLLSAVKDSYQKQHPDRSVVTSSFDRIFSKSIKMLKTKGQLDICAIVGKPDLLIVDNMQFAAGKIATQQEIARCFSQLLDGGTKIVIAFDLPAQSLETLLSAVNSRYPQGSRVTEMAEPDDAFREKYLERQALELDAMLSPKLRDYIVHNRQIPLCAMKRVLAKLQEFKLEHHREPSDDEAISLLGADKWMPPVSVSTLEEVCAGLETEGN